MVRRLQLMEPEQRGFGTRLRDAAAGLRDALFRDNKVLPPVLGALALIVFAWLLAGVIIGEPDEEERVARQAAQPSVAQAPEDGGGSSDTPAPGVENRDSESLDVYESKDPFRELIPQADAGGDTSGDAGGDTSGDADGGTGDTGSGADPGETGTGSEDGSGAGSEQYAGEEDDDFLDQTSPGDPGFDDGNGNGNGNGNGGNGNGGNGGGGSGGGSGNGGNGGGNGTGGGSGNGSGQYGGDGDGNGDLFDSGGDLNR